MENVKNDAICHVTRQNQYNPAGGGATINYTLLGLIEHHGVFIDSGHYVSYIRQSNKWYHCDDKHITETNLLTLSNNVYLMFYAKEVDLGT